MSDDSKSTTSLISNINGLIAFLAFLIIYYNIVFSTQAFIIITSYVEGWSKIIRGIVIFSFISPVFLGIFAIIQFMIRLASEFFIPERGYGYFSIIYSFGMFLGTVVFVGVLAIFVAFESNSYINENAHEIQEFLETYLDYK